ncbi:MAG: hypothetical protein RBT60_07820 [Candidatus Krumholzibacteria bacterium]|nr:hypothetical protein [Candidatus Krumholzibacteria bacterium]
MKRHVLIAASVLLLTGFDSADGQTAARVEYRNGNIDVAVSIGNVSVRLTQPQPRPVDWVDAGWRPFPAGKHTGRRDRRQELLRKNELNHLLGHDMVQMLERHAKTLGLKGAMQGRWFRVDRRAAVLEVTVRGAAVARLYDDGGNGIIDRVHLAKAIVCRR